ncbi:MAG TPA: 2-isopropylmalate synthase [Peptococcaceae bacterium]|nr:MAG: 2-isopropylmalate synthase [Clostridia bacterium 41_269]HBT20588.1 2-isopropylmalate synthase [Peptococcaceae bacterium]
MEKRIYIFDTTLRDGEQSPGVNLNVREKVEIASQLAKLKVDVIEAGFPISSQGDFEAVKAVAEEVKGPVIAALARANKKDIDRAWEALKHAEKPRIHTFIATSDIHLKYKLNKTREEVLRLAEEAVRYAASFGAEVEFSAEDAFRTDLDYLCEVIEAAIEAGAGIINVPDTVGYSTPMEFGEFIASIKQKVKGIDKVILSVHCHNDLGLATANSLAAVEAGAQQVECTINGIGERAGNTSLEEVVMALTTRKDYFGCTTGIKLNEIYRTSRLVSALTGMPVQPNKAIVGRNAFAHESGIHQHGVLQERTTYEIMNPETIGIKTDGIVLGKHSGRHAFKKRLEELGFELTEEEINKAFYRFKELADRKKKVTDEDIEAIINHEVRAIPEKYKLEKIQVYTGSNIVPTAAVGIRVDGEVIEDAACGDGPVDAVFKAIEKVTGFHVELAHYSLNAVTGGKDAVGEVTVKVEYNGKLYMGRGISTDILEASARAYISAINRLMHEAGDEILKNGV